MSYTLVECDDDADEGGESDADFSIGLHLCDDGVLKMFANYDTDRLSVCIRATLEELLRDAILDFDRPEVLAALRSELTEAIALIDKRLIGFTKLQ